MKSLNISSSLKLPLDVVTMAVAILAQRGAGKSYTASVLAEEMLQARQQIIVIDPTGAWWGLKSSADGNKPGYEIVVFGGDHADVPLSSTSGALIASVLMEKKVPAILDLTLFSNAESHRFMADFLETLYLKSREAVHLFIDEADAFAPQRPMPGEQRMLGAMETIVRRGRKRGIGCTMITQRPAVINKNVLTQAELLITMRLSHPKDIAPISEWAGVHGDMETLKKMTADLPALETGTAWFWSPQALKLFERVKVRARRTFDSGATPKPGQTLATPRTAAKLDLKQLGAEIAKAIATSKENDPAELKRRIRELEIERSKKVVPTAPEVASLIRQERFNLGYEKGKKEIEKIYGRHLELMRAEIKRIHIAVSNAVETCGKLVLLAQTTVQSPTPPEAPPIALPKTNKAPVPAPRAVAISAPTGAALPSGDGITRMLIALAQRPGLTPRQLAARSLVSRTSSSYRARVAHLRKEGWVDESDGTFRLTPAGIAAAGDVPPLPTGDELRHVWVRQFGSQSSPSRVLELLAAEGPLSRDQIGTVIGVSPSSSTFRAILAKLRSFELINGSDTISLAEELL